MFKRTPKTPLLVEVTETRYNSYGDPTNVRHTYLAKMLDSRTVGGISDTVKPGLYDFNIVRKGFRFVATLYPHVNQ